MKKTLFLSLLATSVLVPTVAISAISCKPSDPLDVNKRGKQEAILKSQQTKTVVLQSIADNLILNLYSSEVTNKTTDTVKTLYDNKNSQFYKDFKKFFDIFAKKQIEANGQYFTILRHDLLNNNVDITNFNPTGWELPSEQEMDFLFENSSKLTQSIRLEIEKMIIVFNYLIQNRQEVLNITKDENKKDIAIQKVDYSKFTDEQKTRFKSLDATANDLYLVQYLLDNNLIESWSFERTENVQLLQGHAFINNVDTYNKLIKNNDLKYKISDEPELLLKGSDNIDLTKLRGYNGVTKFTDVASGDLSYDNYILQTRDYTVEGFINPTTKKIYSINQLTFNKLVTETLNKKPVISLKDNSKQKETFNSSDFNIQDFTYESEKQIFKRTINNTDFILKLTRIESSNKGNNIRLTVELSIPNLGKQAKYSYITELLNKNSTQGRSFDAVDLPTNIDLYNSNTKHIEGKYIIKIAPRMNKIENKQDKEQKEIEYISSLKDTPWEDATQKNKLAMNIIFLDYPTLYKEVVKYFGSLGLGIETEGMDKVIIDFLKVEGLLK